MGLWIWTWQVSCLALMACVVDVVLAQIRYMIPEELEHGSFVGNIVEDLGLDTNKLSIRRFRLVSGAKEQYLDVNLENGVLFVNERIDREELCEQNPYCSFHLQIVIENPLELYRVEVEILDVNDNSPVFQWSEFNLDISESAVPGSRFPLESAQDWDVGDNSLRSYLLSVNEHFILDVQTRSDGSKFAELILQSPLDREQQKAHLMVLTAVDGGAPERSGTAQINITVLDANDNAPVFDQNFYKVKLAENAPRGTVVIKLNATDLDEGPNGEIMYSFSGHAPTRVRELFSVDPRTGDIQVKGLIDYEKARMHEIYVQAKDRGPSAVAVHCKVMVNIVDVNDNLPEVILTSVSTPVQEDAPPGTVIAVISVMDKDSGENGNVDCEIPHHVPFQLHSSFKNYYTLVTWDFLDRETISEYSITLTARDMGSPPLFTRKTILVQVSDINDNAPRFKQPSYTVYLTENNAPGASICTITAQDADADQNSYLSYSILENDIHGMPVSTYVSINSDNGNIYALRSFDHEHLRNFHIVVQAEDAGFPPLRTNVTVNVFVLDQNDNPPVVVAPVPENDTAAVIIVPRYIDAGYLVAKITAIDADAGQNSRLFYEVLQATDPSLFSVALYTGEIRTIRRLMDNDPTRQKLVVLIKDNGQPPLSATASISLSVVDNVPESLPGLGDLALSPQYRSNLTLYLIVSLGAVSFTFLVAIIVLATIKGYRDRNSFRDHSSSLGSCCGFHSKTSDNDSIKRSNLNIHISPGIKGSTHCVEVNGNDPIGQNYYYKMCLTPESSKSDFMFLKPCSPTGTIASRNNIKEVDNKTLTWSPASNSLLTKTERISPNELKWGKKDRTLNKNQLNYTHKSHTAINTGRTLHRRMMQDPDNYAYQSVSHYWTWGNHMHDFKTSPEIVGIPNRSWTPCYKDSLQSPLDYQLNVYIPGTPSTHCTLKVANNGDLEVYNSFSTFGKKKKLMPNNNCQEDAVMTNDFFI
ncbi:protocadherin-10 [Triplophysa rosa]|uniref:Protocadherin gamma-C3 n=1 Tax=Triplophysa rosa TaxID=992332 RepID=A0A9W7T9R7_TRIRA|nr:protocadherin-10 [Triplophysa rosa]KAI7793064.1 putative protocadherin-10 [Triplophysa rosa]